MLKEYLERVCCASWCTSWEPTEEQRQHWPPRHSDYRDSAPDPLQKVYELYQPVVQRGRWTMGLLQMWFPKEKAVKHSVHVPCWDSFKWNPMLWRGMCFGRTQDECFWTGLRQMRWARMVYAANLGREYVMPVRDIGRHGYKSDIRALFWMYCLMSCIFSCGIGQLFTLCGSCLFMNFGAWYSCHARERLRRRYNLPPTCCMPPGIDDCLVHFFCMYCAVHQEMRELAVRGVDGPGMHILDVLPDSFDNAEGIEEVKAERRQLLEGMLSRPPKASRLQWMFRARGQRHLKRCHQTQFRRFTAEQAAYLASAPEDDLPLSLEPEVSEASTTSAKSASSVASTDALGWYRYSPPDAQEMERGASGDAPFGASAQQVLPDGGTGRFHRHSIHHIPVLVEESPGAAPQPTRAWSVAY